MSTGSPVLHFEPYFSVSYDDMVTVTVISKLQEAKMHRSLVQRNVQSQAVSVWA